jgi:hypothetical protein
VDDLGQFVFVVRVRIGECCSLYSGPSNDIVDKTTNDPTYYIDVKSEILCEILREILEDVRGVSLAEDMPSVWLTTAYRFNFRSLFRLKVEQNLLFHFLPDLESYRTSMKDDSEDISYLKHLDLLIEYMQAAYELTSERLQSLLKRNEITYDLLWALFKSGSEVYATCEGTRVPRCVIYDHGAEKVESNGTKYFLVETHYLDFDGKILGEAITKFRIPHFRGSMQINLLYVYPFKFHTKAEELRKDLIECGRKFVSLMGIHHQQYEGYAFRLNEKGEIDSRYIKNRIMVDAVEFQECNPNYLRPRVYQNNPVSIDISSWAVIPSDKDGQVKNSDIDPKWLKERDLLVCSPTVLGFSFDDKVFRKFTRCSIEAV